MAPRGRPKKWANENERRAAKQRKYRQRKRLACMPNYLRILTAPRIGNVCPHGMRLTDTKPPRDTAVCPYCGIAVFDYFAKEFR